jgi:hypothetical protein
MKTILSIYLVICRDLIEDITVSEAVELNSEKLSLASRAKKDRLDKTISGSLSRLFAELTNF